MSYHWIMKNIGFFLFLAALAVIYIYNGHYADKIVRDINRTNKELKETLSILDAARTSK